MTENNERKRARTAAWHAEHAAYRRAYLKRWRRLNRDKVRAYNAKRKPKGETV